MLNLLKKNFLKTELVKSSSFIQMIRSAVKCDYVCVDCNKDDEGLTYFIYPESCYQSGDTYYGCLWLWDEDRDPTKEFVRFFAFSSGELYELLYFTRILQADGGYKNLEIRFTGELIDSPNERLAQGIALLRNFANLNGYTTPPPYVAALEIYASAS